MRQLFVAVFLILASMYGQAQSRATIQQAHKTTYHIAEQTVMGGDICSATAVGPHALLTASHCEAATDDIYLQGKDKPAHIEGHIRDGHDHTIYLLSGITFSVYSTVDLNGNLQQGDDVFMFGNPGMWSDVFRRGYMAGKTQHTSLFGSSPTEIMFDMAGWHGDSGAAIFSTGGAIVGVVTGAEIQSEPSSGDSITMTVSFEIAFKPGDLAYAQNFGVSK